MTETTHSMQAGSCFHGRVRWRRSAPPAALRGCSGSAGAGQALGLSSRSRAPSTGEQKSGAEYFDSAHARCIRRLGIEGGKLQNLQRMRPIENAYRKIDAPYGNT